MADNNSKKKSSKQKKIVPPAKENPGNNNVSRQSSSFSVGPSQQETSAGYRTMAANPYSFPNPFGSATLNPMYRAPSRYVHSQSRQISTAPPPQYHQQQRYGGNYSTSQTAGQNQSRTAATRGPQQNVQAQQNYYPYLGGAMRSMTASYTSTSINIIQYPQQRYILQPMDPYSNMYTYCPNTRVTRINEGMPDSLAGGQKPNVVQQQSRPVQTEASGTPIVLPSSSGALRPLVTPNQPMMKKFKEQNKEDDEEGEVGVSRPPPNPRFNIRCQDTSNYERRKQHKRAKSTKSNKKSIFSPKLGKEKKRKSYMDPNEKLVKQNMESPVKAAVTSLSQGRSIFDISDDDDDYDYKSLVIKKELLDSVGEAPSTASANLQSQAPIPQPVKIEIPDIKPNIEDLQTLTLPIACEDSLNVPVVALSSPTPNAQVQETEILSPSNKPTQASSPSPLTSPFHLLQPGKESLESLEYTLDQMIKLELLSSTSPTAVSPVLAQTGENLTTAFKTNPLECSGKEDMEVDDDEMKSDTELNTIPKMPTELEACRDLQSFVGPLKEIEEKVKQGQSNKIASRSSLDSLTLNNLLQLGMEAVEQLKTGVQNLHGLFLGKINKATEMEKLTGDIENYSRVLNASFLNFRTIFENIQSKVQAEGLENIDPKLVIPYSYMNALPLEAEQKALYDQEMEKKKQLVRKIKRQQKQIREVIEIERTTITEMNLMIPFSENRPADEMK